MGVRILPLQDHRRQSYLNVQHPASSSTSETSDRERTGDWKRMHDIQRNKIDVLLSWPSNELERTAHSVDRLFVLKTMPYGTCIKRDRIPANAEVGVQSSMQGVHACRSAQAMSLVVVLETPPTCRWRCARAVPDRSE